MEGHSAPAPGVEGVGAVCGQDLILQVDIEDMGGEAADGFGSVGLAAEFEVGWFVDQAEVGAVDGGEDC